MGEKKMNTKFSWESNNPGRSIKIWQCNIKYPEDIRRIKLAQNCVLLVDFGISVVEPSSFAIKIIFSTILMRIFIAFLLCPAAPFYFMLKGFLFKLITYSIEVLRLGVGPSKVLYIYRTTHTQSADKHPWAKQRTTGQ